MSLVFFLFPVGLVCAESSQPTSQSTQPQAEGRSAEEILEAFDALEMEPFDSSKANDREYEKDFAKTMASNEC